MKARYIVALAIIILAMILFEYLMLAHPIGDSSKLGNAIQAAAVFVALLAAVAAIAASDPKPKQVNVGIEPYISTGEAATHSKAELPSSLISVFAHLQDTFQSYRVHFRLTNHSGFTLVAPTITLRLPIDRRHPIESMATSLQPSIPTSSIHRRPFVSLSSVKLRFCRTVIFLIGMIKTSSLSG